jgi:beta-glucosidase
MRASAILLLATAACGQAAPLSFASMGPLSASAGHGGFRFGVATAATQIEDQDTLTDWYLFTEPKAQGGLGNDTFVGDAAMGYTHALDDVDLISDLHVDSYRFSIEWARVMPTRHTIDEDAIAHYRAVLTALIAHGIRPMVTVHHFSTPVWIDDPRDPTCANGPSDTNLCGLGGPGGPLVIEAFGEWALLLGERFGDLVDEWGTLNEPVNYLLASQGVGSFPPGKAKIFQLETEFLPVLRDYLSAHASIYAALKLADTVDADGDGIAASVGLPLSVIEWAPANNNAPSTDPDDAAAVQRITYVYHYLVPDALTKGGFDTNLDGTLDEPHPDWANTLDWLGLQHYLRAGVTAGTPIIPVLNLAPCFASFDLGACLPPLDPTFCVPQMHYEYHPGGLYPILTAFAQRYPTLPLLVTEGGIASDVPERRSANIVRSLEQIARARADGADVRGYYHWSLYDNFEWNSGFAPHFGLYSLDRSTYARTATSAATIYGGIASSRRVAASQRDQFGGDGPLPPEPSVPKTVTGCTMTALGF